MAGRRGKMPKPVKHSASATPNDGTGEMGDD